MTNVNWKNTENGRWMATVEGSGIIAFAGQNDDGSFYWSCGGVGHCSAPIATYKGITNPAAYIAAAIERCKADAAGYIAKILA